MFEQSPPQHPPRSSPGRTVSATSPRPAKSATATRPPGAGTRVLAALLSGSLLLATPTAAVEIPELGVAHEGVSDSSKAQHGAALLRAFDRVLLRLTGHPPESLPSRVNAFRKRPQRYLLSDSYLRANALSETPSPSTSPPFPFYLRARFDVPLLKKSLRAAGVPVLGRHRPQVLAWVLISEADGRRLLINAETESYAAALKEQAREFGLPIFFPLLDLEDNRQIGASDLLYAQQAVLDASRRYNSDSVLILALQEDAAGQWRGAWSWYAGAAPRQSSPRSWENETPDLHTALRTGLLWLGGHMVRHYGASQDLPWHQLKIHILGVNDFQTYVRVLHYLESLASISQVQVLEAGQDRLDLLLETRGGLEALRQNIRIGEVLGSLPERGDAWFSPRP